jgi:PAS domain S-box-containing protein
MTDRDPSTRQAHHERDTLYRLIVESAQDFAIFSMDMDGRILTWNTGAQRLIGYAPDEIIGRYAGIIFTPEDCAAGIDRAEMQTALERGRAEDERWHVRKGGERFWASGLMMTLKDDAGQVQGLIKIIRDRTELRRSQEGQRALDERLQLVLRSALDYAIFTTDGSGHITSWSPGAFHVLGYQEADIIGRHGAVLFTPEDRAAQAPEREMELARTEGRAENQRWHLRADGSRFWGSGVTMPLRGEDDQEGFLKIMRDATERHLKEENQAVLLREVSHRVKNSLALVASMLTLQARGSHHPDVRQSINDAATRVGTIASVHDQLWQQQDVQTVELSEFIGRLCASLQEGGPGHQVRFMATTARVSADQAIPLALIVNELVTNAFKHAYPRELRREVRVILSNDEQDGILKLEIADDGVGLPEEFDPAAGSGGSLGMRMILSLAAQLGGQVEAPRDSTGACFVVTFRARHQEQPDAVF